jgi:hypothetical protein
MADDLRAELAKLTCTGCKEGWAVVPKGKGVNGTIVGSGLTMHTYTTDEDDTPYYDVCTSKADAILAVLARHAEPAAPEHSKQVAAADEIIEACAKEVETTKVFLGHYAGYGGTSPEAPELSKAIRKLKGTYALSGEQAKPRR